MCYVYQTGMGLLGKATVGAGLTPLRLLASNSLRQLAVQVRWNHVNVGTHTAEAAG